MILTSFIYFDHIKQYPYSIVENYNISINSFFDYVDDKQREQDGLAHAKAIGREAEAKSLIAMGFRFLKPMPNWLGFFSLLLLPILTALFVFQFIDTRRRLFNRFFNKTQKFQHVDQEVR